MSGLFIGGASRAPLSDAFFPVHAPADGTLIGQAPRGDSKDIDRAVMAAREAYLQWSGLTPTERELCFLKAADLIEARSEDLVDLVIDESGSTITKARGEVAYSASILRTAAGEVRRLYGDTFPADQNNRLSLVVREPMGVVGALSPFNAALVLLVKMVSFPLAAGNTVVAKPSEETPLVALALAEILHEAGFPAGAFNVVTGLGPEAGVALVSHPSVDAITFTGSTSVGLEIAQNVAKRLARVHLELGGKNPVIVLADADLEDAATRVCQGAFAHGGQICMASARIIVEGSVARPFAELLAKKAEALKLGDLRDPETAYGPLINERSVARVDAQVQQAVDAGVELLTGGRVHEGLTYAPTVLFEPKRDLAVWTEETFGPVVSVVAVDDLDEAIDLANDSCFGLSAGILTRDIKKGLTAARKIRAGSVHVGSHSFHSDALAPIGGFGLSSLGRSGGKYSVEHFTELKWISVTLD